MSKDFDKYVGEIIKNARKSKGFTQLEVAQKLGKERSTYAYYETGKISIDLETFKSLCYILDIDPYEFLRKIL